MWHFSLGCSVAFSAINFKVDDFCIYYKSDGADNETASVGMGGHYHNNTAEPAVIWKE